MIEAIISIILFIFLLSYSLLPFFKKNLKIKKYNWKNDE